ncbi:hypothetical protein LTR37_002160 [Vermiconidia calcicola]|uniref:Uncharacterized protein n=1 Tax=Vermiconidia calcicola TaxID=1690605 RepID=A0ACC3NVN7_9PEZI|nr:hypothetical protein LTR37_002160 [Vermiconidia calcicola]
MAGSNQVMDLTLGDLSVTDATDVVKKVVGPPIPNFPLPRELRDQIYAYLLNHQHVSEMPYYTRSKDQRGKCSESLERDISTANTYRFHPSILAVNGEMSEESKQVLLSNNFIVVSHICPALAYFKHRLGLTIVTENQAHIARFRHHVMRFHVQAPPGRLGLEKQRVESFLMIASNITEFCRLMQWMSYQGCSSARLLTRFRDMQPHDYCLHPQNVPTPAKPPSFKIQFQDRELMEQKPDVARALMSPLRHVIAGLQNVKIINTPNSIQPLVQSVICTMSPKTIWTVALAWDMVETLLNMKQKPEQLLMSGKIEHAIVWYNSIWKPYAACGILHLEDRVYKSDLESPVVILFHLMLAAAIMEGFVSLRLRNMTQTKADELTERICNITWRGFRLGDAIGQAAASLEPNAAWLIAMCTFLYHRTETGLAEASRIMAELKTRGRLSHSENFEQDIELIDLHVRDKEARHMYFHDPPEFFDDLFRYTSAVRGPINIIFSPATILDGKPEGLVGFVDTKHLEQIRAADPAKAATLLIHNSHNYLTGRYLHVRLEARKSASTTTTTLAAIRMETPLPSGQISLGNATVSMLPDRPSSGTLVGEAIRLYKLLAPYTASMISSYIAWILLIFAIRSVLDPAKAACRHRPTLKAILRPTLLFGTLQLGIAFCLPVPASSSWDAKISGRQSDSEPPSVARRAFASWIVALTVIMTAILLLAGLTKAVDMFREKDEELRESRPLCP